MPWLMQSPSALLWGAVALLRLQTTAADGQTASLPSACQRQHYTKTPCARQGPVPLTFWCLSSRIGGMASSAPGGPAARGSRVCISPAFCSGCRVQNCCVPSPEEAEILLSCR